MISERSGDGALGVSEDYHDEDSYNARRYSPPLVERTAVTTRRTTPVATEPVERTHKDTSTHMTKRSGLRMVATASPLLKPSPLPLTKPLAKTRSLSPQKRARVSQIDISAGTTDNCQNQSVNNVMLDCQTEINTYGSGNKTKAAKRIKTKVDTLIHKSDQEAAQQCAKALMKVDPTEVYSVPIVYATMERQAVSNNTVFRLNNEYVVAPSLAVRAHGSSNTLLPTGTTLGSSKNGVKSICAGGIQRYTSNRYYPKKSVGVYRTAALNPTIKKRTKDFACVRSKVLSNLRVARFGHSTVATSNGVLVVGGVGKDGMRTTSCEFLAATRRVKGTLGFSSKSKWRLTDCLTEPRFGASASFGNNRVVVSGGGGVDVNTHAYLDTTTSVECLRMDSKRPKDWKWSSLGSLTQPRMFHGMAHVDKFIYVVGGATTSNRVTLLNDEQPTVQDNKLHKLITLRSVEVYSEDTDKWTLGPHLPVALRHPRVVPSEGGILVCGGVLPDGTNNMAVYRLSSHKGEWVKM